MTITAEIIADAISESGTRITTFELVYPRLIHSEFMTHRLFSRNAASSRAIPVKSMNDNIMADIAKPIRFGKKKSGMQDDGEHSELIDGRTPQEMWDYAASLAVEFSNDFDEAGYAKQVCNRLTEPFQHMKVVLTATTYDNFFWLRNHTDADPTIHMLAVCMLAAYDENQPRLLMSGEWHVPYYQDGFWSEAEKGLDIHGNSLDDALKISSSCCAQVSYRKNDDSLEKAKDIYAMLIESAPVHASPVEHQATPMNFNCDGVNQLDPSTWEDGPTHMDRNLNLWSGNFKDWIQHRQLIPDHTCSEYQKET